jgi:glycosyltransferase involved in cell wall biosynthesis
MRILYFGNYDADYGRNRVIVKGLRENGAEVVYCNGGTSGGIAKFLRLILRYLKITDKRFDLIIVAFPAQETMIAASPLLVFLRFFCRTPVVVDMLTSHYDGYILDRKRHSPKSFHAKWYKWLDRTSVGLADLALVDCYSAGRFWVKELGVPAKKIITVFIGTDDDVLKPKATAENEEPHKFLVHFHGSFVPLQGAQYIIEAVNILKKEDITFQIIGKGQDYKVCRKIADDFDLKNIVWIDHVSYDSLPNYINKADICLGTFGGNGKFHRCAANKVYEYMACGKAILTGRSDSLEKIAEDGVNMVLCNPADGQDLADKILMLKNNPYLRKTIGEQARTDYLRYYTPKQIMARLLNDLKQMKAIS